jgi:hypothetical protein
MIGCEIMNIMGVSVLMPQVQYGFTSANCFLINNSCKLIKIYCYNKQQLYVNQDLLLKQTTVVS